MAICMCAALWGCVAYIVCLQCIMTYLNCICVMLYSHCVCCFSYILSFLSSWSLLRNTIVCLYAAL